MAQNFRRTQFLRTTGGDVVQLVRTLPRRWLESYTVTANSLPRAKGSRARTHIYLYIYAYSLPRNARFSPKWERLRPYNGLAS